MVDLPHAVARSTPLDRFAAAVRPVPAAELSVVQRATRLSLRVDPGQLGSVGSAFGTEIAAKAGTFTASDDRLALWLGPDEWLLIANDEAPSVVADRITEALGGTPHAIVDVSERSVTLVLAGPMAATVINAGCPLDLSLDAFPVGSGTRTVLAKSEILLCRTAEDAFLIDVWRSFSPYVWQYLDEARREFVS